VVGKINEWLMLVSHLGIIGGMVLVAFQIEQNSELIGQNTKAMRAQELADLVASETDLDVAMMSENLSESYSQALYEPSKMTTAQILEVGVYLAARVNNLHRIFQSYEAGLVAESDWNQQLREIAFTLATPFGSVVWDFSKGDYSSTGFVESIDSAIVANADLRDDDWLKAVEAGVRQLPSVAPLKPSE
jgi:hypothetical protein